ncbi:MAG: protease modulator HflC [Alphaproteobacteria bacterium]|nr:protease modulator HflC [Alphaproteobacteria bacterium]
MNRLIAAVIGVVVIGLGLLAMTTLFVVRQTEQVIVLQFGDPLRVIREPGLNAKLPWQSVETFDKRVLGLDPPTEELILSDQRRINVDSFARYRIIDPLRFYQTVRTAAAFDDRFGRILNATVRRVLAMYDLVDMLSPARDEIMGKIRDEVMRSAGDFGIEIVDLRIGRTELPEEVSQNVFARMRSEREREANRERAEGEEVARRIRAQADRQQTVIIAEAQREAEKLRGDGEATRTRILAEAFNRDPAFFDFYRTLEAYKETFHADDTTLVLSPDSEFFRFFGDAMGRSARQQRER